MKATPFSPSEVVGAGLLALAVQTSLILLVVYAGRQHGEPQIADMPRELSVAIEAVSDSSQRSKGVPSPAARQPAPKAKPPPPEQAQSVPTPFAKKVVPAKKKKKPRPTRTTAPPKRSDSKSADSKRAERVSEMVERMRNQAAERGEASDEPSESAGSPQGAEGNPLRARAVDLYRFKLTQWFKRGFRPTTEGAPCDELQRLNALVRVQMGTNRRVRSFRLTEPSGNSDFDARVRERMDNSVGKQVPPPPPSYPDVLKQTVRLVFSGKDAPCE